MATEQPGDGPLSVDLPPDLDAWVTEQAEASGLDRDQLFRRLLEATRLALSADEDVEDVRELERQLSSFEDEVEEMITDVRERVVQVKQETDGKADVAHTHESLERVDELDEQVSRLDEQVTELRADVETLETTLDEAEASLETATTRLRRVAAAVVRLQQSPTDAGAADERLTELRRLAAKRGFRTANCDACGESVDIALLPESNCPHCDAEFHDITGRSGLFTDPTLVGEEER